MGTCIFNSLTGFYTWAAFQLGTCFVGEPSLPAVTDTILLSLDVAMFSLHWRNVLTVPANNVGVWLLLLTSCGIPEPHSTC